MKGRSDERNLVTLLGIPDVSYKKVQELYVIPPPGSSIGRTRTFWRGDKWLSQGTKLEDLSELYGVARRLHRQHCQKT